MTRPNVLVVGLDALRLDYWRKQMPLARAATEGFFRLDSHWAVAHCSDPNFSAALSGYGPWSTGITTQMGRQFDATSPQFLQVQLQAAGYFTWAVMPLLVPKFYRAGFEVAAWHKGTDMADLDLQAVRRFTDEAGGRPWFGFMRDFTTHYPYGADVEMPARGEVGEIREHYEAAVAHVDQFVANLIEFVLTEYPNTMIFIFSDHGEGLGEHGLYDHLYTLWSVLVRTPMAVYVPGLGARSTRAPTQHVDIAPTIRDLLELSRPGGDGVSWAPWLRGDTDEPAPRDRKLWLQGTGAGPIGDVGEDVRTIDPGIGRVLWRHRGVVWSGWKLVEDIHADGSREMTLTKSDDYLERKRYEQSHRRIVNRMSKRLPPVPDYHDWEQGIIDKWRQRQDRAILRRLKALGYA